MNLLDVSTLLCGFSFAYFGFSCLRSKYMRSEFTRYGLAGKRVLVGYLQILGGIGLLSGWLFSPVLGSLASLGLFLLMILGFGLRMKIRDGFWASLPSLLYAVLSGGLFWAYLMQAIKA
ncbi:MAG: DoxX family protein [Flavobacteriaceae bacterium]